MNLRSVQLLLNRGPLRQKSSFMFHRRKPRRLGTARVWFYKITAYYTPLYSILRISGSVVELSLLTWGTPSRFPVNAGLYVLLIQKCISLKGNLKLMRTWLEGAQLECAMKDSLIIHSLPAFQRGLAIPIPSKCTISSKCCRALVVQW